MKKLFTLLFIIININFLFAENQEEGEDVTPLEKFSITGGGHIMFGRIAQGHTYAKEKENLVKNQWVNFYSGRLNITSRPTDWFKVIISPEIGSAFPVTATTGILKETYKIQYRSLIPQAVGIFDFDLNTMSLMIEAGVIEYNFNPEIKNLGNYMYRSTSYPLSLKTKIDYPYSNLFGIHSEAGFLNDQVKAGILINSILHQAPFNDISVALFGSYQTPNKLFDAGIGICFDRLFSVKDSLTDVIALHSWMGACSTLTLRSTKVDIRASLDVKKFFGENDMFGKNDAKIYAEVALLGLKDPDYFPTDTTIKPSLMNRLPLMIGFNIPTFKVLDLFSIELEYCKYPYAFDWWGSHPNAPSPIPEIGSDSTWKDIYKNQDNLKWTIYLKKSIQKFHIIAFFANDHMLYDTYSADSQPNVEQSLRTKDDWHWYFKLAYDL